jgi:hypothetical protein
VSPNLSFFWQPCHVLTEHTYRSHSLFILLCLASFEANADIPVRRSRDDHFGYQKEVVQRAEMPIHKLTPEIIAAAIEGLESQKGKIDLQIGELRHMLPGSSIESATRELTKGRHRKMSAVARARIAKAQKKRWQLFHNQQGQPIKKAVPERKLSAAAKAKLVANLKKARAAKAAKRAAA